MSKTDLEYLAEYLREGGDMLGDGWDENKKWFYKCSKWVKAQADKLK